MTKKANVQIWLKTNRRWLIATTTTSLSLLVLAFPLRALVVPAIVNGRPIYSWQYVTKLHQRSGPQVLEQMINELLVEQEIAKQGIQVAPAAVDQEINLIESQVGSASGGLDALLSLQGLTRTQFTHQVKLQLALEKLVKSTIQITDEDIAQEIKNNATAYADLSELEATTQAAENLRQERLTSAFTEWFETVKAQAKIRNFFASPK